MAADAGVDAERLLLELHGQVADCAWRGRWAGELGQGNGSNGRGGRDIHGSPLGLVERVGGWRDGVEGEVAEHGGSHVWVCRCGCSSCASYTTYPKVELLPSSTYVL